MQELNHTDGELLTAFVTRHDEAAFGELVQRHGRLLQHVARRVLGDEHEAQDVAQAAFLALARKAPRLRLVANVAPWLHRVAHDLAVDAWRGRQRRQRWTQEEVRMNLAATDVAAPAAVTDEQGRLLQEELARLPDRYRAPLVLCYLEGQPTEQAALALGLAPATLRKRLERGRERLRHGLVRAGWALDVGVLPVLLAAETGAAVLPPTVVAATCQAASLLAAGKTLTGSGLVSAKVAYLTKSALKTLFWAKVKTAATAVVLTAGVAVAGGLVARQLLAHRETPPAATAAATAPATAQGLPQRSPADAWIRELLVRAETGPWDALDFTQGVASGAPGVWRLDARRGAAARRLWQTAAPAALSMVQLDEARWKRGVVVGRVMMLPAGELPAALAIPEAATKPPWARAGGDQRVPNDGVALVLYAGAKTGDSAILLCGGMTVDRDPRGAWHRLAVYFDTAAPGGPRVLAAVWPAAHTAPPAAAWRDQHAPALGTKAVGLGLVTQGVPALWEGIKLVPLGPELPLPPPDLKQE